MMIEKELLKQTYGNGRLCPIVEKPYDECYFVKMKSQDIAMAMLYCYENFEICGIYRNGEHCAHAPVMAMKLRHLSRKMIVGLIALIFFATLMTGNAFAAFQSIYMTNAFGSYTQQTEFSWDETPWVYLQMPNAGLNSTAVFWNSPDTTVYFNRSKMGIGQEYWFSLDSGVDSLGNSVSWADIRETGEWDINASYVYAGRRMNSGEGSTSFTVTPEPVSSVLFIAGSAVLAGRRYWNKTQKRSSKQDIS